MDLIEILNDDVSDHSISLISQKLGIAEEQSRAGIFAAIPAVLAGLMKNSATGGTAFINQLLPGHSADRPASVAAPDFTDGQTLIEQGESMLRDLFGEDTDSVAIAVSEAGGIGRQKAAGLLAMVTPVIMSAISRLMSNEKWSFSDLLRKLFDRKSHIVSLLPGTLSSTLGMASVNAPDLKRGVSAGMGDTHSEKNGQDYTPASSGGSYLKWLIPLILVALVAWWLLGRESRNESSALKTGDTLAGQTDTSAMEEAASLVAGSLNAAGDWVYDLGPTIERKLPDGTSINIGENSVENRLINFIEDDNLKVDKSTWFSFDRLYFETGKSALKPESKEQLSNIAAIMKAYPNVQIKLGGYTDSTGNADTNKRLSTDRAVNTMKELARNGVPANRMEAEGYGSEHPVAGNDTPEGRAKNRRIDIRITAK